VRFGKQKDVEKRGFLGREKRPEFAPCTGPDVAIMIPNRTEKSLDRPRLITGEMGAELGRLLSLSVAQD
jgi:hypothetical protein